MAYMKTLKKIERPETKKQVRSFLGLTRYYRDFIQSYSTIVAPLTDLTQEKNQTRLSGKKNMITLVIN